MIAPLMFALFAPLPAAAEPAPTFNKHVAPILFKHCASCHRPGEVGPFSLLTYKDAFKRADFLKDITASRRMPPWMAESQEHKFVDERRLSDAELKTLAAWADAGAPEGAAADLPPQPKFPEGWQLGKPDLIVKMPSAFALAAGGRDQYPRFTIPLNLTEDKFVAAIEFRPGNRRIVHHALIQIASTGRVRGQPDGGLGAWVPGATPRKLADGMAMYLPKASVISLQIHYHPSGKAESDLSEIGLYFTPAPAAKLVTGIAVAGPVNIPADNAAHKTGGFSRPLPTDVMATAIFPHMHLLGKEMKATARLPGGKEIPLIHIKDWNFNWQDTYHFEKPIALPKGTVVRLEAVYDNSKSNALNPNSPPKQVRWGEQTTDEMCLLGLQVTAASIDDLRAIHDMAGNRLGATLVGGLLPPAAGAKPEDPKTDKPEVVIPAEGVTIPDRFKAAMKPFDKNGDGKLTKAEIDAMPPRIRDRVMEAIPALLPRSN